MRRGPVPSPRANILAGWLRPRLAAVLLGAGTGLLCVAAVTWPTRIAQAKSTTDSAYGFDRTWNAALRLVRVDMGLKVTDKDEGSGYLLFDYKSPESGGKTSPGSLEVVRGRDAASGVHVVIQLPSMPRYHEQVMLDALAKKLREDYGDPPATPPADRAKEPKDAGTDADD